MKTLEINLAWTTDPCGLFATEADMTGVDVVASMAEYDGLLIAAVREAFPDAMLRGARRLLEDIRQHPDEPPPYVRVVHEIDRIDKALREP